MEPGQAESAATETPAGAVTSARAWRCWVFAPTLSSSLLLATCMLLPFGVYGGCNNTSQVDSPRKRQAEAIASSDIGSLIFVSLPYAYALAIALGTLAAGWFAGRKAFLYLWTLYAALIGMVGGLLLWEAATHDLGGPWPDLWRQHGFALLSAFWLVNVVLASWLEAPSRFVAAMILQGVIVLLIGMGLAHWLLFLESLLLGGWLTAICLVVLPLATGLQLLGDPAASRESASQRGGRGSGIPQFSLRGLLTVTTLLAATLATGQVWGFEPAAIFIYAATFAWLTLRPRERPAITRWYACVVLMLTTGWLLML